MHIRCKTLDKLSDISSIGEGILLDAKFYGTLGTILENGIGKTAKIYPVEIDYKKNRKIFGCTRNTRYWITNRDRVKCRCFKGIVFKCWKFTRRN